MSLCERVRRADHQLTVNAMTRVRTIMDRKTTDATMRTRGIMGGIRRKRKGSSASRTLFQFEIAQTDQNGCDGAWVLPGANMVLICLAGPIKNVVL